MRRSGAKLDLLMVIGIDDRQMVSQIEDFSQNVKTALFFDCAPALQQLTRLDGLQADRCAVMIQK